MELCKAGFSVESYMVDFRNKLRLSLLLGMQQETAFRHAEQLFAQYGNPAADGCFWVVTQSWTSILRMPRIKEYVNVETWVRSISRVSSRRNFRVTDDQGQVVALTSMDWVIVNLATRRPQRLDGWGIDRQLFRDVQASPLEGQRLRKIPELTPAYSKTVRYSDIDENNHANNTRYVDWILDSFGLDFLRQKEISHIYLSFKQECAPGDRLTILKGAYPEETGGNMCCGHNLPHSTNLRATDGRETSQETSQEQEAYYMEGRFEDCLNKSFNGSHAQAFQAEILFSR
ncbi:MAG: thioesterase [Peptococcaceae bacterium]|nr:thioesterase [Peptococcaceae bacterium]